MTSEKKHPGIFCCHFAIFFLLILLHFSVSTFHFHYATTVLWLAYFVAFAMFCEELSATVCGFVIGFFVDAVSSAGSVYHTFFLGILGLAVSLLVHYWLNQNIRTALVLSFFSVMLYYFFRWLFFHAIGGVSTDSLLYLLKYAFPSVLLTSVFIIPFYYLNRKLHRIKINK